MSKSFPYILVLLMLFPFVTFSQANDNIELKKMFDEDQSSRSGNIDWDQLSKNDSMREKRVYELIESGQITTGMDYYHSALIFQHGRDSIAYGMAVKQMKKAIELDSTIDRWLLAAAIDRDLMSRGRPQIYGTQYQRQDANAKWERYNLDTMQISDSERIYYHVETLAEQKVKEHNLNLISISIFYAKEKSLDKVIKLIKAEKTKGDKSDYRISEDAINVFGYELMNSNRMKEALSIFKLNTQLYPTGFNTFDSYGECLLKLGKKEQALKAYKKSFELNPQNKNAENILSQSKRG